MNWSARGNVLNQYLRNTSIGTTVISPECKICYFKDLKDYNYLASSVQGADFVKLEICMRIALL
jgi:hypothetical protein